MADTAYQPTPWIDSILSEANLLDGIAGICTTNGWTKVAEFTKVSYLNRLTMPTIKKFYLPLANPSINLQKVLNGDYYIYLDGNICPTTYYTETVNPDETRVFTFAPGVKGMVEIYYSDVQGTDVFDFYVAKHYVVKNTSGNLFGMAHVAHLNEQMMNTGCKVPFAIPDPSSNWGTELRPQDEGIFSWAIQKANAEKLFERHTLYFYQLEKWIGNGKMLVGWDNASGETLKRLSLDAEVQTAMWGKQAGTQFLQYKITDKFPQMYQSPIVVTRTRIPQLETTTKIGLVDVKYTNWWDDSSVFVKGFVDGKSLMLIIVGDTAPVWEANAVPAVPLYMGDFDTDDTKDETVSRDIIFEFQGSTTKKSTVISTRPMLNQGAYVKVWLMGDTNGDFPNEAVTLTIAGQEIGKFNTAIDKAPTLDKNDAQFMGQFDLTGINGKNSVDIEAVSGSGSDGFSPISARMWLEIHIGTDKKADGTPAALFSGTAYHKDGASETTVLNESANFDYDDAGVKQETLLPMLKDYPHYASNGVDSVMVKRTKFGARYQAHYISWAVPSDKIPPLMKDNENHKYPRAWDNYTQEQYGYQFNPSRYSGKAHSSRATLVHPEDGKFGTLRNVILVSPLTIMNGDELKATKDNCAPEEVDKYEVYAYYLVEGISPLTKRPATAFRPAGLGILKEGYTLPPIPPPPPAPPSLVVSIDPASSTVTPGSSIKFTSTYGKTSPITNFSWSGASDLKQGSYSADTAVYTFPKPGVYTIKFTVWNELGQMATATATITVSQPPAPPPPPPPPPPPNTLVCGVINDTGGGVLTEKYHEMGEVSGVVTIDYDMYSYPDRIDVYYQNQLLATTNGKVSGAGQVSFSYQPVGGVTQIKVVVTSDAEGSSWTYTVNCPV